MDFSSRQAETLHLSPTHAHSPNTLRTWRRLHRAISKSPSKVTRNSMSPNLRLSVSPSPASPLGQNFQTSDPCHASRHSSTDESAPSSAKRNRPGLTRSTPIRGLFRNAATEPRPSLQRALSTSSGNSNVSPTSFKTQAEGQENTTPEGTPPSFTAHLTTRSKSSTSPFGSFSAKPAPIALSEADSLHLIPAWLGAKSSPLKRSDGPMSFDQPSFGSPSAKRRSLHGVSFEIGRFSDDSVSHESEHVSTSSGEDSGSEDQPFRSTYTPRSAAPRKLQFHGRFPDRTGQSRVRRSLDTLSDTPARRTSARARPRTSVDSNGNRSSYDGDENVYALSQQTRGAEASPHDHNRPQFARSTRQHPHPLSQALSPNSPLFEDHSTTAKAHAGPSVLASHAPSQFARSLPIGALRPTETAHDPDLPEQPPSKGVKVPTFGTPSRFDVAKPDPAAFRSTGLISKRHRDPDDLPPPPGGHNAMPDTPCKKTSIGYAVPESPIALHTNAKPRISRPPFGAPAQPFANQADTPSQWFGNVGRHADKDRRSSIVSNEGLEPSFSPSSQEHPTESQSSNDESPPTPTKQVHAQSGSKSNSLRSSLFGRRAPLAPSTFEPPTSNVEQSPLPQPLFSRRPSPLNTSQPVPCTPLDAGVPDPSQLSITPVERGPLSPCFRTTFSSSLSRPPETPTSHGHSFGSSTNHAPNVTPSHHAIGSDVDYVLRSRFRRAEWYAKGEFSEVYKVYQPAERPSSSYFAQFSASKHIQQTFPDKVYVVKKLKAQTTNSELRQKKLKEAAIMRALGKNDHIVHLIDSWEANFHLYIQTEFCEEGSLEQFLARKGRDGRLDDFRIWKIFVELAHGVAYIHQSGFIHLDLKPANVFIDFEGVLKIGDFGLASEWPAPRGIENEGDRRYIGPDLLLGLFDKPADVFALGAMMYEIAANCFLPDNGSYWHTLRSGDLSGLPSLTSGSSGITTYDADIDLDLVDRRPRLRSSADSGIGSSIDTRMVSNGSLDAEPYSRPSKPQPQSASLVSTSELVQPPNFMTEPSDPQSLDSVVQKLMRPEPKDRPTIDEVLRFAAMEWVDARRRAGAVIYEGRWGPAEPLGTRVGEDCEMMDV